MTRALLIRGMLIGILAGLLVFVFARIFGEPEVDLAIGFEEHMHHLAGGAEEPELVSRAVQASWGLLTAVVVYGAAFGGIFSLVFAFAHGRLGRLGPRATAGLLALAGFVAIVVVPQIKYPSNPPSIGNPDTIGIRTALYFGMIVISIVAMVATINLGRGLLARLGTWNAVIVAAAAYVVVVALAGSVMPPVNEVPDGFSAVLLWNFRLASLGMQVILWTTLGLGFGALAAHTLSRRQVAPGVPHRV
jgi:hypothetical protein